MKYLIDTHTLIWYLEGNRKISETAVSTIKNLDNDIYVSVSSFWEIAIKMSIGKLKLPVSLSAFINTAKTQNIRSFQFADEYILVVEKLPFHHKDPFDRIIIATAITEKLPIISTDPNFDKYGIDRIW